MYFRWPNASQKQHIMIMIKTNKNKTRKKKEAIKTKEFCRKECNNLVFFIL